MLNRLTKHQGEVLTLLCAGCTDAEIAGELGVTPASVRHQTRTIQLELQERSIAALCRRLVPEKRGAGRSRPR